MCAICHIFQPSFPVLPALERARLRRLRFHDLRHAFGSAAITKLDPYAVQSYTGHHHYSTTQRYLHHKPRREDAARLADAFGFQHDDPGEVPKPTYHGSRGPCGDRGRDG